MDARLAAARVSPLAHDDRAARLADAEVSGHRLSGGVVFFCEDSGAFAAADAKTGKLLWHFQASENWKASPMTFMAGGKQYVAVAAGANVLAFALP